MSKNTNFITLGANNHTDHEYEKHSFYATDPNSLAIFLTALKRDNISLNQNIWECAVGSGTLADVLIANGYKVHCTDLIDRNYPGTIVSDFLKAPVKPNGTFDILTNPPYKVCLEFVKQALNQVVDGDKVIMFLKVQFLEGQERRKFFEQNPPKYVYVNSSRQACYMNGDFSEKKGSAVCYCWYIWEKGFKGDPAIRWI